MGAARMAFCGAVQGVKVNDGSAYIFEPRVVMAVSIKLSGFSTSTGNDSAISSSRDVATWHHPTSYEH